MYSATTGSQGVGAQSACVGVVGRIALLLPCIPNATGLRLSGLLDGKR